MRAMVVSDDEGGILVEEQVAQPSVGEGQVAIRMKATAVSFADIEMREGRYHTPRTPPVVPGHEAAGEVVGVGRGVTEFSIGDRVTAISVSGSYAEVVVCPAAVTWAIPDEVDMSSAAAFPTNGVTAYNILTMAGRLNAGESVLVHAAAGGVGTTTVQLAKALGAKLVIGTVGDDSKAEMARELGCDHVINYRMEEFSERTLALTEGHGVDVILDSVAGKVTEQSLRCLAPWGRIVLYGMSGGRPGNIPTDFLHAGNRAAVGYSTGGHRYHRPHVLRPAGEAVLGYMRQGVVKMVICKSYPIAEANSALDFLASRQSVGRIVLTGWN